MYHAIVKQKLRAVFARLSTGDYEGALKDLAPRFEHVFAGSHTFGGSRHSAAAFRRWFERLFLVFPDLQFDVKSVQVVGWPWGTAAAVEWVDCATLRDGSRYVNEGCHVIRLRWGRVVSFHVYLDTDKLSAACHIQAALGLREAEAPQIQD